MKILKDVLKKARTAIIIFLAVSVLNFVVFLLYGLTLEPAVYSFVIGFVLLFVILTVNCFREKKKADEREQILYSVSFDWHDLPDAESLAEKDYQEMIGILGAEIDKIKAEYGEEKQNSLDYYTTWVHQIKTPIAVMKLKLSDDTPEKKALLSELFRIEQYVDMVLQYIRLGSDSNDLLIREYSLDDIIKDSIRKYAPQFIEKKLILDYHPTEEKIITDKKWFSCILDQLLSNSIKYTPSGTVSVFADNGILTVSDTGIGIADEDIPRIFEKGFTGNNGRIGQKSSGLGLYLAKKISILLNIPISVESSVGKGTSFTLMLKKSDM